MSKVRIYIGLSLCGWALVSLVWIVCLGVKIRHIERELSYQTTDTGNAHKRIDYVFERLDSTDRHLAFYDDLIFPVEDQLSQAVRDSMLIWQERFANGQ